MGPHCRSWHTIFDVSGTVDVVSGLVYGPIPEEFRVTWEDGATDKFGGDTLNRGSDANGDLFRVNQVPPIKDASKLEFFNRESSTATFGYTVQTI